MASLLWFWSVLHSYFNGLHEYLQWQCMWKVKTTPYTWLGSKQICTIYKHAKIQFSCTALEIQILYCVLVWVYSYTWYRNLLYATSTDWWLSSPKQDLFSLHFLQKFTSSDWWLSSPKQDLFSLHFTTLSSSLQIKLLYLNLITITCSNSKLISRRFHIWNIPLVHLKRVAHILWSKCYPSVISGI